MGHGLPSPTHCWVSGVTPAPEGRPNPAPGQRAATTLRPLVDRIEVFAISAGGESTLRQRRIRGFACSRSTASRTKSVRSSSSCSTFAIRAKVPAGKRAR
jgi:hypothetical protein